ncbi:type II secretion system minor pseudopilin GspI [Uliginosibacterium sp. H3]|uniref:Type II secretion system protein I n=1 Tax=Uliginosibacterium silvisoli TaxID=3114758 RepID=A0ABU6K8D2_9RHOO|nr:type II secretion system minor pseudopilin GspI [Uliginosibacterium sp. H3]
MKRQQNAFTLLEVLIALAMLAIVLTAAFRGINLVASQAAELGERHMAQWVAQNRLAELRMTEQFPDTGPNSGKVEQGGLAFTWQTDTRPTDNPLFRRVNIKVLNADGVQLASLIGFVSRP